MANRHPTRTVLAVLAGHNLMQNYLLNERGYVAGNLAVSAILVAMGRASGLGWDEMGLHPSRFRHGLRTGSSASVAAGAAALLALSHPQSRFYLRDQRAAPAGGAPVWRRALIRFPLGTAIFEEIAFRGVLTGLFHRHRGARAADWMSAGAFAIWHLIPTARAISGNPIGERLTTGRRAAAIVAGSVAAGGFGLVFSAMRRRSGSVLAPWLAHAALNSLSYLAGAAAWRLGPGGDYRPGWG